MKQINRFTHVEGVAVYNVVNGVQDESPAAVDISINVPEITFEATEVPMMGSVSVVDQTRVQALELEITIESDNPNAIKLFGPGVRTWRCAWVESILQPNGLTEVLGFYLDVSGYCTSYPEGSKELGSQATGSAKLSLLSMKKTDSNNKIYYDIDRTKGLLKISGVDYRENINKLL